MENLSKITLNVPETGVSPSSLPRERGVAPHAGERGRGNRLLHFGHIRRVRRADVRMLTEGALEHRKVCNCGDGMVD